MSSRVITVPVLAGVATIPRQPQPYRIVALAGTIVLDNINVPAGPAVAVLGLTATTTGTIDIVQTGGAHAGTTTIVWDVVDPGGVVFVDVTGLLTTAEWATATVAAFPAGNMTAAIDGGFGPNFIVLTSDDTGAAVTLTPTPPSGSLPAGFTVFGSGSDPIVPTAADTLAAFVEIVHGLQARICEIITEPIQSPQLAPANVVVTFALGLFQISAEVEDNEWSATQSMIRNLTVTSEDVVTLQPVVRGSATFSSFTNVVAVVEDIDGDRS